MKFTDTIAAISTAPGTGAISVVRLSGPETEKICKKIFSAHLFKDKKNQLSSEPVEFKSHSARHGYIYDQSSLEIVDEVVLTFFKGPNSYTGEDLAEISCHGSPLITHELLTLLLNSGARLARRGEFTQQAFLNGRMDLTQAESVQDLIQAKTSKQRRIALSALSGRLGKQIDNVRKDLIELLTRIVAGLDFPEEIGDAPEPEVEAVVKKSLAALLTLTKTARAGKFLREGLKLALVGRPNAGKSSLLNQLLKYDRAIVTEIPGTTRDSLEELLDIKGIPVTLIDTAGIRQTDDLVEKIGIERSQKAIAEADLVVLILDLTKGWSESEDQIVDSIRGADFILVGNKIDLCSPSDTDHLPSNCIGTVQLSAKTGENLSALESALESWVYKDGEIKDEPSLNLRQSELCLRAYNSLLQVEDTLHKGMPQDCLASDLKIALDSLSEISGTAVSEEIITQVFATFCIGK
ncbi:MAG: tRNA uridine-5-carboxymethylaminomethyl(34) synthesis GTPase MnmE [Candidatus Obscuribacterales bacterium]|nr:tRNA uridine-5-carboxymethylaminomethyl(34) synthesis GTPase MnmE [Candidatus Obscuribacterales bacterium]